MEAVKCPVCEGKQVVPEDFYPDGLKTTHCRSCQGSGYVTVPEQAVPVPTYMPMPYPVYPSWPWPNTIWSGTSAKPVTFEQRTFGIGETNVASTPYGIVSTGSAIGS